MDTANTHTAAPSLQFDVPAMSCGHCVGAITRAVQALDAQAHVQCDLPTHRVRVTTHRPREAVADALAEAGYPPA
jgi:copper chaperone